MHLLIGFLILLLPIAALVLGSGRLDRMFKELEALNPDRVPVVTPAQQPLMADPSAPPADDAAEDDADNDSRMRRLTLKQQAPDPAPPPCFLYKEPGTRGEIICTRLPWMNNTQ
jgi:hypothetical protein